MNGDWLALGVVAALAAASSARGSRSHRPSDVRAVKQAHDKRVLDLKLWMDEQHGGLPPQARKALWDSNTRFLRRRFQTELEDAWNQRRNEAARWVDSGDARQGGAWRDRILSQPYAYHFTAYDRLPSIREHGLVGGVTDDSRVMRDKPCVFFTTAGGGRMWARYASDKRVRQVADKRGTYWGEAARDPATRLRANPIALRVSTTVFAPRKLRLDRTGTIDGLFAMKPQDDVNPDDLFAFCYLNRVSPSDLEWARVNDDAQIEGPWLPVTRGSRARLPSWVQAEQVGGAWRVPENPLWNPPQEDQALESNAPLWPTWIQPTSLRGLVVDLEGRIYGVRAMHDLRQDGYAMRGRVSLGGRKFPAFTGSRLFVHPDGSLVNVSCLMISVDPLDSPEIFDVRHTIAGTKLLPRHKG